MSSKEFAIGIDLGTTNSCVAVVRNEIPEVIPNDLGDRTTPSIVTIEKDGTRIVGKQAKDMQLYKLNNTIFESKRLIGRKYEPAVQERMLHWPFKVEVNDGKGNPRICVTLSEPHIHKKYFYPEEISGMILHKMKKTAEDYLKCTINRAVITAPAYFNDNQRQATIDAAKLAGLDVLKIINEPTAAAFAYILRYGITRSCNTLVFDLGGGTLDLSIIHSSNNEFNVVAVNGDPDLGGADFDIVLYNHVSSLIRSRCPEALTFNNVEKRRIIAQCTNVKEQLSQTTRATFQLLSLFNNTTDFEHVFTRSEFEALISQLIKKIMGIINATLNEAKMSVEQVDNIVLVGGSSKIPAIIKSLEDLFKRKIEFKVNPYEAVACGAALQAAKLMNEDVPKLRKMTIVDVTPFSLGIEAESKYMDVIIRKNTALPVMVRKMYTTILDNQSALRIIIYQGEDKLTSNNTKLGEFDLVGIPEAPARVPQVWVTFDVNTNGVLHVTAMESSSNQQKKVKIITSTGRISENDLQRILSENQAYLEKQSSLSEAQNQSRTLRQLCLDKIESVRNLKDVEYQVQNNCINSLNQLISHLESLSMSHESALKKISTAKSKYEFICRSLIKK